MVPEIVQGDVGNQLIKSPEGTQAHPTVSSDKKANSNESVNEALNGRVSPVQPMNPDADAAPMMIQEDTDGKEKEKVADGLFINVVDGQSLIEQLGLIADEVFT